VDYFDELLIISMSNGDSINTKYQLISDQCAVNYIDELLIISMSYGFHRSILSITNQ